MDERSRYSTESVPTILANPHNRQPLMHFQTYPKNAQ
jgi:hypothetical protein